MNEQITGAQFKQMVLHGAACITAQKQAINDLNVFPVPDGDTGTNMSMTIGTAVTELRKSQPTTIDQAASITASALLRGARGNSGVILSLLFRGISKGLKGRGEATAAEFAAAMQEGVSSAYKAVMKPAEGTVLTVSRLAAKRAVDTVAAGETDVEQVLAAAIEEGRIALDQTIEMNPVLKKAGVVDAGGKGFLVILEGMLAELRGEPMPAADEAEAAPQKEKADFGALSAEEITFAFDTVFIVRKSAPDVSLEPLRTYLNSIGDSLVIGEDDEAFKVHVHTNIPGSALTESQKYGTLELAKIENMRTQAEDLAAGRKAQSTDDLDEVEAQLEESEAAEEAAPVPAAPEKPYGFLAVCAGEGLAALFRDLGCDGVVSGGQTMNPSTESILQGVEAIPAETVFVLPNNGNIIMAAQQADALTEKHVVVIPTKTVPQGITAMMNADFDAPDAESITAAMTESLSSVTTAQITYAARDSDFDGFDIKAGDYLALEEGKLFGTDGSLDVLLDKLAADAVERSASFISLYFGEDVSEEDAQAAGKRFESACPDAEISVLSGGQPVYYYIISME
ncbi:MAG: DAK2 domain-containing protein [Dysosmobacter sp.]